MTTNRGQNRFRRLAAAAAVAAAGLALLIGCVTNPITGQSQFSLVGRNQLVALAREAIPSQFASDYGLVADARLQAYVSSIGKRLVATLTPEDVIYPDMPFNFQVVNAVYINAYAFPDGTIAVTRGMLAAMENEAQLAAVLGHEIAHVNCGHTAAALSRGVVMDALVSGTRGYLASQGSQWANLAGTAGQLGSAVVLASYSREQERQADQGGMTYMARAGYDPQGMVELMRLLTRLSGANPSALERMFSSHPMSEERLRAAETRAATVYAGRHVGVKNQEAYLAATAGVRGSREALNQFATAERQLAQQQASAARASAEQGLRLLPNDYVGLMLLAQARHQLGDSAGAGQAARQAATVAPNGARAQSLLAQLALERGDAEAGLRHLHAFERLAPGEPRAAFFRGLAYESLGRQDEAAQAYRTYLRRGGGRSAESRYAQQRLQQFEPPQRPVAR